MGMWSDGVPAKLETFRPIGGGLYRIGISSKGGVMAGKRTSIYIPKELQEKLRISETRGLSQSVNETIDRYQIIVGTERKRVEALFTENEWNAMRNACSGTIWQPAAAIRDGVLANIQDTTDQEIEYFEADRTELESKLRSLSAVQQFALVELIEEWWWRQ